MAVIFEARVKQIGALVEQFAKEKMLIIFDHHAPKELHDITVLHEERKNHDQVKPGDQLVIGNQSFQITRVGEQANNTLHELGHVTFKFIGDQPDLPGTICVEDKPVPTVEEGLLIQIIRENEGK
ncbi:PTS system, glucitol/sorbitol-specific IIA component [Seinonella peptonophila]|uniref:PTS system, glucitol/sorbitol-specific IIA component n=1 Tax=Seinonella peptonophila TaxID=112248 RepID=A0A1M4WD33_9BACL|nr:PTS glucitol/sorbitol transporter subunit IIA [Seinonella peptonophila]SHE79097.1 PTS system, glucitol/sorbitol-specific IIA component [Seinonella peptonophila]